MAEIMRDLIEVETCYDLIHIIDGNYTFVDIVRFAVKQSSALEIQFLLDQIIKAESAATEEN